jgi:UDP-glucose 4-epimerase
MKQYRILITGGAGYVGSALVSQLAPMPAVSEIVVYDNLSRGEYNFFLGKPFPGHEKVRFVPGDLLDSRTLRQQLQGIDLVYHLAAHVTTPFGDADAHQYEQVNHWGTAELVYAAEEVGLPSLIFLSSTSVYGASSEAVNENSPLQPKTFYGISKQRAEEHVQRLVEQDRALILRCGNVYGYNRSMRFDAVINRFMFDAQFRNRLSIQGDGHQRRAFIHIEQLCSVVSQLVSTPVPGDVYNLTGPVYQLLDIVEVLEGLYPGLEFIFINQHLRLRELVVEPPHKLGRYLALPEPRPLEEELKTFKEHFSFAL